MPDNPNPAPEPGPIPAPASASAAEPAAPSAPVIGDCEPGTSGLEPKIAAGICCIFPIVGSIIFLVLEKKDKFVRFWAMQSLLLGAMAFVVGILLTIAQVILGHMPFVGGLMTILLGAAYWIFRLGWLVVYIISIVKAFSKQEWEIPFLGKIAREQLARMDRQAPAAS
jgi:uncharacterized membrane protein